ncbi:hypothetical protein GDO86_001629 [Hymenochirus boettgeri]|uniref:Ig-like domain-containing protein n=1 Tax=Hymenochirus boettgeri TaxID=247094 RepID=A0A8T2KEG8_9PIPI|nr:hypothetical protein GDO86_001629 [Hymenochirus boettgeri]
MLKMKLWFSVVICTFVSGLSIADEIKQISPDAIVQEGEAVSFICTYETASSNPYLHWYVQQTHGKPHFILLRHLFSKEEYEPGKKYSSKITTENKSTYLRISGISMSDAGMYFCALSTTVSLSTSFIE